MLTLRPNKSFATALRQRYVTGYTWPACRTSIAGPAALRSQLGRAHSVTCSSGACICGRTGGAQALGRAWLSDFCALPKLPERAGPLTAALLPHRKNLNASIVRSMLRELLQAPEYDARVLHCWSRRSFEQRSTVLPRRRPRECRIRASMRLSVPSYRSSPVVSG